MSTQERFTAAIEQAKSEGVSIRLNAEAHDNSGDDSPLFTFDFDGKLEWVDGGLVRDIGAVSKDIDRKISSYLNARSGAANQQETGH